MRSNSSYREATRGASIKPLDGSVTTSLDDESGPILLTDQQRMRGPKPELLVVCLARGLGGSTRSLVTVLDRLPRSLRRVLCTPRDGLFMDVLESRGLIDDHVGIPNEGHDLKGRLSRFAAMIKIVMFVRKHRDVLRAIHANGPEELNLVVPAALLWKVRVVVWSHARDVSPWMRRLRFVLQPMLRRIDVRWAAVSDLARDVLVESGYTTKGEVRIVPNPIDPSDIVAPGRARAGKLTIGFLGSDAPYKGFHMLPDVLEGLMQEEVEWLIFSNERSPLSGDAWRRLRVLPPSYVSFPGKISNVSEAYAQLDLVFMPSLDESFGRVAAEAMLNGLPVVASDLVPVRTLLADGEAGRLFPPGDVTEAVRCIRGLLMDPAARRQLGERGRELAERLEPSGVVASLVELYESDLPSSAE